MDKATQEASDRLRTYIGWDEQAPEEERLSRPDGYWAPLPIPLVRTVLAALDAARAREQKLRDVLRRGREALLPGWLDNCLSIKEREFLLAVDAVLAETEARDVR